MCISNYFYTWKTNRMTLFCNLFINRPLLLFGKLHIPCTINLQCLLEGGIIDIC